MILDNLDVLICKYGNKYKFYKKMQTLNEY